MNYQIKNDTTTVRTVTLQVNKGNYFDLQIMNKKYETIIYQRTLS